MPFSFSIHMSCGLKLSMCARKNFKSIRYAKAVIFLMSYIMKTIGGGYQGIGGLAIPPQTILAKRGLLLSQRAKK